LIVLAIAVVGWLTVVMTAQDVHDIPLTHPAINDGPSTNDPVAVLLRDPNVRARLESTDRAQLLKTLLDALSIPQESQMLVFLSGSLQQQRISTGNPRALYFNDSVSVGWVRGGFIEIASQDPTQGTVFYTAGASSPSLFVRESDRCLSCHFGGRTGDVPGMIERNGHTRPLDQRWGGWYVTGQLGGLRHLGNVDQATFLRNPEARAPDQLLSLDTTFDTSGYLTPHSDVVALLVFEHQMHMANLLTRIGWDARVLATYPRIEKTGENAKTEPLHDMVTELVDYLLFVDEAPLPAAVTGTSGFAAQFGGRGPADRRGRSLRQLDLERRLLRYPCSYMIYSDAFDALPPPARDAVYARMWRVLSGQDAAPKYARLSAADRRAIVEILRDTKPALPAYFSPAYFR
jgi:hypothetical protein